MNRLRLEIFYFYPLLAVSIGYALPANAQSSLKEIVTKQIQVDLSNKFDDPSAASVEDLQKILTDSIQTLERLKKNLHRRIKRDLKKFPAFDELKIEQGNWLGFSNYYKQYSALFETERELKTVKESLEKLPQELVLQDAELAELIDSAQQLRPFVGHAQGLADSLHFDDEFSIQKLSELTSSTQSSVEKMGGLQEFNKSLSNLNVHLGEWHQVQSQVEILQSATWEDMEQWLEQQANSQEAISHFNKEAAKLAKLEDDYRRQVEEQRKRLAMKEDIINLDKASMSGAMKEQAQKLMAAGGDNDIKSTALSALSNGALEIASIQDVPRQPDYSLKGKPLGKRLILGGYLQLEPGEPYSLDLSPQMAYRLDKRYLLGFGVTYRLRLEKQFWEKEDAVYGGRLYSQYFWRNWVSHAEWERLSTQLPTTQADVMERKTVDGAYAGIGRNIQLNAALQGQVLVLYNFLHEEASTPNNSPFVFRFGIFLVK
jgi:uncharacterized membrane-anchored protein YhcB (DUF1043 family)